jgi:glycosyltransferase involved in cell wall biosynthesis
MKIGLVVPGGFDPSGRQGVIPALLALTQQLGERHHVRVFAASSHSGAGRYRVAGAEVTQLGRAGAEAVRGPARQLGRARRLIGLGWEFARWIASFDSSGPIDLLHAFWADRTALLAGLAARRRQIPLVVSVGGGEAIWLPELRYGGAGSLIGRLATSGALRLADAITTGSAFALSPLPPWAAARAQIVPLGVNCRIFAAPPARPMGPPWRLLQVASLNRVKGHPTLLAAMRRVVDRLGDVRLDCVGEDTLDGQVQRRADQLGLASRVVFHGGLQQQSLAALYRTAHLHVVSSHYESQGVVILEAAAAGLPTVGSAVGLLPSLAPTAARCVPQGHPEALADAICALLLDGPAREAMGAAAQRFGSAHDATWTAQTFERLYASLLAARKNGSRERMPPSAS